MRYSFTSLLDHCTDLTLLTAFMRTVLSAVCSSRKTVAFMTPLRALLIDHICHIMISLHCLYCPYFQAMQPYQLLIMFQVSEMEWITESKMQ